MIQALPFKTQLQDAFASLRSDLIHEDGPRISTMRNYRFAIVQYEPKLEFDCRAEVQRLSTDLQANGWIVFSVDLQKLLFDRIRAQGDAWMNRIIEMETQTSARRPERGLNYLRQKLQPLIEGPDGLAADCSRIIGEYVDTHPDHKERMLCFVGRAGAVYPFFRSSALLRHVSGRTENVPVVLLYPGKRVGPTGPVLHGRARPRSRLPTPHLSVSPAMTLIRDLYASDVTRDISPVVYFHEQSPEKLRSEVNEYIITGGWPEDHPNHRARPERHSRAVRSTSDRHRLGARQEGRA